MKTIKNIALFLLISLIFSCSTDDNIENEDDDLISCEGDIILRSQEEINAFAQNGCQKIIGSLTIDDTGMYNNENADISDLSPLNTLVEVTGSVIVVYSPNIENLNGLHTLTKIGGSLAIHQNDNLLEINGFNNLQTVGNGFSVYRNDSLLKIIGFTNLKLGLENESDFSNSNFEIAFNPQLQEVIGFDEIEIINFLHIRINDNLTKIIGFNNLTETGEFLFSSNPVNEMNAFNSLTSINGNFRFWSTQLTDMSNFSSLENVEGRFWIDYNHQLINLNGLENLTSIADEVRIGFFEGNLNLQNIEGLVGLNSALKLHFQFNHSLTSLNGLENLSSNTFEIDLWSNENLSDFCAISNLVQIVESNNGYVNIFSNLYNPASTDFENGNCAQ